jgi:hypothetical protein
MPVQRFLSFHLLLIVIVCGSLAPRQVCLCTVPNDYSNQNQNQSQSQNKNLSREASFDHGCCKRAVRGDFNGTLDHGTGIRQCRDCCGKIAKHNQSLAGDLRLESQSDSPAADRCLVALQNSDSFKTILRQRPSACNRAPPGLTGMGSSKTYLYKRSFLI